MVTRQQVRKLMKELAKDVPLARAAIRSGMSEKTARRYRGGARAGGLGPREYRTRADPFAELWPEVRELLEAAPGLEAGTLFEWLRVRPEVSFEDGQLRTFQRGIRRLRAQIEPGREVMFAQVHRPGEAAQSDFSDFSELSITIAGEAFPHLYYHFVLPYSNWETGEIAFSESFEALVSGLQNAVWKLGRVPWYSRTDNLSAATHQLKEEAKDDDEIDPDEKAGHRRKFNKRYRDVLAHYGMKPDANTPGRGHENGDVEQAHHRFKRAVEQALLLRRSRDFSDRESYVALLEEIERGRNRHRARKLAEELAVMRELPLRRLEDYRRLTVPVSSGALIRVASNSYMVPTRLIGEDVDVRLYAERVEVWFAGESVHAVERFRGRNQASVNWRFLTASLVKKPGAFRRYRYRESLFPNLTFRRAYEVLDERLGERADVEYVRILHLAGTTSETEVTAALELLLEEGELPELIRVAECVAPREPEVPELEIPPPDLTVYDGLLGIAAGGAA